MSETGRTRSPERPAPFVNTVAPHFEESCGCDPGCSHGVWCGWDGHDGDEAPDWPCAEVLAALGYPDSATYVAALDAWWQAVDDYNQARYVDPCDVIAPARGSS